MQYGGDKDDVWSDGVTPLVENAEGTSDHREPLYYLQHTVVSATECTEGGNSYRIVPDTDCRQYYQVPQIPSVAAGRVYTRSCPSTLIFDPVQCTCNWPFISRCPDSVS